MAARRRLMKELQDIRKSGPKYFRDVVVDEQNIFQWQGLIVPEAYPYNKGTNCGLASAALALTSRVVHRVARWFVCNLGIH
jgi:hypothetical protein